MRKSSIPRGLLEKMTAPADLFVGTGPASPVSVRNVLAFSRMRARELGARKSFHHRFVLCFNLHDSAAIDIVLDGITLHLAPGQYILFFPHQLHTYENLDDREIAVFFITFETDDGDLLYHLGNRVFDIARPVRAALCDFIDECTGNKISRRENHIVLAAQALLEAIILNDRVGGREAQTPIPRPLKEALLRLSEEGAPTVVSMAKEAGISEAYLRKIFKKSMGIPLGHYLAEMRQNKARSLLGASDESVSHIAELCGYKSVYSFSRSFRAFNDCTPSRYRERARNRSASSPEA